MKPLPALALSTLIASAAGRAVQGNFQPATTTRLLPALQLRDLVVNNTDAATFTTNKTLDLDEPWTSDYDRKPDDRVAALAADKQEAVWCKAKSRGAKLIKAMMMNDQEAQTTLAWPYLQSPWDGDLKPELKKWGYKDDDEGHKDVDDQCDFDKTHEMADAFKDLKVDPRSAGDGGPNHCFFVEHMNGDVVIRNEDGELPFPEDQRYNADGKKYQVTQAYAKIGINAADGIVYFIHRQSPEDAAGEHWGRKPAVDELPALRSSSDIAWGMWNRVASGSIQKLNYFMAVQIVNEETQYIMKRALKEENTAQIPTWPGKDFQFAPKDDEPEQSELHEMEAAIALLGSSNGLGAGYFIIQHRRQLGRKYISKVKIWMAGEGEWALPNILFYVSDRPTFEGQDSLKRIEEQLNRLSIAQLQRRDWKEIADPNIVHKSKDGKNVIREHVIMAKL